MTERSDLHPLHEREGELYDGETLDRIRAVSKPTVEQQAEQWMQRQKADNTDDLLDAGDCRTCGAPAGEGHEETDPCGIIAGLLAEVGRLKRARQEA